MEVKMGILLVLIRSLGAEFTKAVLKGVGRAGAKAIGRKLAIRELRRRHPFLSRMPVMGPALEEKAGKIGEEKALEVFDINAQNNPFSALTRLGGE
jgi:hypothetical protein